MLNILITGVSSGIGKELSKSLTEDGHKVVGVSRRAGMKIDLSKSGSGRELLKRLKRARFKPSVVIFNAAILENDLEPKFDSGVTRRMFETNFFSVLEALEELLGYVPKNCHFIAVSSIAALRGSSVEGIGYSASKAALSIAFEGLHQKYRNVRGLSASLTFTTIYLGPVRGGMSPFRRGTPFQLSIKQVVELIKRVMEEKGSAYYSPWLLFFGFRILRLFPPSVASWILSVIERVHRNYEIAALRSQ
ncbi:MAG: SDR family NAD(P)-dependent oxidoreductase [bacterium]|nr:SDR family NAD(P)-dependent oxidoreductase [bacterium]